MVLFFFCVFVSAFDFACYLCHLFCLFVLTVCVVLCSCLFVNLFTVLLLFVCFCLCVTFGFAFFGCVCDLLFVGFALVLFCALFSVSVA